MPAPCFVSTIAKTKKAVKMSNTYHSHKPNFQPMRNKTADTADAPSYIDPKLRGKQIIRTSYVGIAGNVVLSFFKIVVGAMANSIAIILDGVNNATDVLSSVLTIVGTKIAGRKASRRYPFGFGRMEYLTSLAIAVVILVAGGISLWEAIGKMTNPVQPDYSAFALTVIIASIIVKIFLGIYMNARAKKLNCGSLSASSVDSLNDALLTGGTLVAAIVFMICKVNIDGIVGVIISLFVLKTGFDILKKAIDPIIGVRGDDNLGKQINEFVCSYPDVLGAYDLFLDDFGPNEVIGAMHIEVPDDMTARRIHELTRTISEDIYKKFHIAMTIGIYAANEGDTYQPMRRKLHEIANGYKSILQVHAFYVDETAKTVSFDLVVDFKADDDAIREGVTEKIKTAYPQYSYNVVIDTSYID